MATTAARRRVAASRPRMVYNAWAPAQDWSAGEQEQEQEQASPETETTVQLEDGSAAACSVRAAGEGDLAAVSALVDRTFEEAEGYFLAEPRRSESELRQAMESTGSTVFVADHGWVWAPPKCVGAVRVDVPSGSPEAYMAMLAVAPEQQRQGIGRMLVEQAEALAHSKGCKGMNLHASSCRKSVLLFYERLGYKVVGTEQLPEQVEHLVRPEYNTPEHPFLTTHFRKEISGLQPTPKVAASIAASEAARLKVEEEAAAAEAVEAAQAAQLDAIRMAEEAAAAEAAASAAKIAAAKAAAAAADADAAANEATARAEQAAKEAFRKSEDERVACMLSETARGGQAEEVLSEPAGDRQAEVEASERD